MLQCALQKVRDEFVGGSQSFHTFKNLRTVGMLLTVAECIRNAGACAVITTREARRGLIVPVAVEGKIPSEISPELDVVLEFVVNLAVFVQKWPKIQHFS
jgi:hypothetical protein